MEPLLDIQNIHSAYGPIKALKGVSITVNPGSITAILGANGAGKSTLLKSVSGLVKPQSGAIHYAGTDITKMSPEKIAQKGIVHVPEGRRIFGDLTVKENLMIGAFTVKDETLPLSLLEHNARTTTMKHKVDEAVRLGVTAVQCKRKEIVKNNLARVYELFPVLAERKDQIAQSLSGGEQQMLAIGRGLMSTPKLLILDEPSLGLAPMIVKNIFSILRQLNHEGITVLIVEQNALQTLKIADEAYVLQVGSVIKHGSSESIMNDQELINAYLGK